MDTELLVENRIEDGQKLVTELVVAGFDVSVAAWVKTGEEGLWSLYIGSTSAESSRIGDAYRTLYACLSKIPDPWVDMSEVQLIEASNPIAKDAMAARDRQPGRLPLRFQGKRLGNLSIEEAYIYPRIGGPMTPREILQTLLGMANRPAGTLVRPSVITLRGGTTVTALITGFDVNFDPKTPLDLTIHTQDPASNTKGQVAVDDVINIQP
jgi:hypothetical protein